MSHVPINCRQRLAAEGKPFPKSSCASCGQFSPKANQCDAMLAAPAEQAPAVAGETEEALLWLDDFVARCNGDDRGECVAVNILRARLVELEAQQGEPVAWDVITTGNGSWCKTVRGRQTAEAAAERGFRVEPLFRQAQPVTAKVVLPVRRAVSEASREQAMCANTWNACLDEIAKLNPPKP